jgi:hypothetical protein
MQAIVQHLVIEENVDLFHKRIEFFTRGADHVANG